MGDFPAASAFMLLLLLLLLLLLGAGDHFAPVQSSSQPSLFSIRLTGDAACFASK